MTRLLVTGRGLLEGLVQLRTWAGGDAAGMRDEVWAGMLVARDVEARWNAGDAGWGSAGIMDAWLLRS